MSRINLQLQHVLWQLQLHLQQSHSHLLLWNQNLLQSDDGFVQLLFVLINPLLFLLLAPLWASIVLLAGVCRHRLSSSVMLPAGWWAGRHARGRSGGRHSTAGLYGYVALGRHFVFRCTLQQSRPNKVSLKCPSIRAYVRTYLRMYVRMDVTYVRLSTKSSFDFNQIWHIGRGRWVMHDSTDDGMTSDWHMFMTWFKVKVTSPSKLESLSFSKAISSAIYSGSW